MKASLVTGLAIVAVLAAAAGAWRNRVAAPAPCGGLSDCARCHREEVLPTHHPEFLERTHGAAARLDRAACLQCHREPSCQSCHERHAPTWHDDAFRHPGRGPTERAAHARIAREHAVDCTECHQHGRQRQCASCHPGTEWPK